MADATLALDDVDLAPPVDAQLERWNAWATMNGLRPYLINPANHYDNAIAEQMLADVDDEAPLLIAALKGSAHYARERFLEFVRGERAENPRDLADQRDVAFLLRCGLAMAAFTGRVFPLPTTIEDANLDQRMIQDAFVGVFPSLTHAAKAALRLRQDLEFYNLTRQCEGIHRLGLTAILAFGKTDAEQGMAKGVRRTAITLTPRASSELTDADVRAALGGVSKSS